MNRKTSLLLFLLLLALLTAGCLPVGTIDVGVEPTEEPTPLPPTQTPEPTEEPTPLPTETPEIVTGLGIAAGNLCYPSEVIPEMTAFFRNEGTGDLFELPIAFNQTSFEIELPAGEYVAFAYLEEHPQMGGSYSAAVACGLSVDCGDHSLMPFTVLPGETTGSVDLCDWYAPESVPPNPKASQQAEASLAGLVYRSLSTGNIWRVDSDGSGRPLASRFEAVVSTDGARALYVEEGDIWLLDLENGIGSNLTNTPDRDEFAPQWWPANPLRIVFNSADFSEERGLSSGHVSMMNLDGSGYTVIEENLSISLPGLSPDGRTIAYDSDGGWLYSADSGAKVPFVPTDYGLEGVRGIVSASWSPDGSRLAWWVQGDFGNGNQIALAIFDLAAGDHSLIHPYTPIGGDGVNPAPAWSPDGIWLASTVIGDQTRGGLWVFRADGSDEINLGNSANPVWSPEENLMAFVRWPEDGGPAQEATLATTRAGEWVLNDSTLPLGSIPLAWLVP